MAGAFLGHCRRLGFMVVFLNIRRLAMHGELTISHGQMPTSGRNQAIYGYAKCGSRLTIIRIAREHGYFTLVTLLHSICVGTDQKALTKSDSMTNEARTEISQRFRVKRPVRHPSPF